MRQAKPLIMRQVGPEHMDLEGSPSLELRSQKDRWDALFLSRFQ